MTQKSDDKNTEIIEILRQYPDGLSRGGISNKLSFYIENKTLYRKLSQLVKANLIRKTGDKRATKYFHLETGKESNKDISHAIFSENSMKALKYLDNPTHSRPIMSYNRAFLDAYVPDARRQCDDNESQRSYPVPGRKCRRY